MSGKFELYNDKAGDYRFRLKAGNGQIEAIEFARTWQALPAEQRAAMRAAVESLAGK